MRHFILFSAFFTLLFQNLSGYERDRRASLPFLTGDTLRASCDHIYDEDSQKFYPLKVKENHTIFIRGSRTLLARFFDKYHPKIKYPYRLVTNNSDHMVPGGFKEYLNDPKIIKWFAANGWGYKHPKLIPIPRGMPNRFLPFGDLDTILRVHPLRENRDRPILAYLNFRPYTHPNERNHVYDVFQEYSWAVSPGKKTSEEYLIDLSQSKFVISPRGAGLDCYRTWEALTMGAIPVVKTSDLDPMFDELPVLIIQNWEEVTEEFLLQKYEEFQKKTFKLDKIYGAWWIDFIRS